MKIHSHSAFRRILVAGLALVASACAAQPKFESASYDEQSANRLFSQALGHLADNYIDPVDMRSLSVAGVNGLTALDEEVRAAAGPGRGYVMYAGDATPISYDPPSDRDSREWARLLANAVTTARARSAALQEKPPEELYTAVMKGITGTLDAYSRYEPPRQANESRARREGYGGIGVTIRDQDGQTVIQEVMPNSPASRAGLLKLDVITHADGVALATLEREARAERLRGPIGQSVAVSIERTGAQPFTVRIEREEIVPTTVYFENDKGLPRFRIAAFSRNTADSLAEEIAKAEKATGGLPGIVLDLRGNPGGYLTQAIDVADLFLDDGLLVSTNGRHPSSSTAYRARVGAIAAGKPMVVLIDGGSASASELLAAALVDSGRAAAVGSVTYGKGSIQNLEELANGGELIVTWSRMHAPSGYLLDGLGVLPTVCTVANDVDAATLIRASSREHGSAVAWRAYQSPDLPAAARLRASCPKVETGGDIDLDVARMLLKDRNAYEASLVPAAERDNHARLRFGLGRNG